MIDTILVDLKEEGLDMVAKKVKNKTYEHTYYYNLKTEEGEVLNWIVDYNNLVNKYYV